MSATPESFIDQIDVDVPNEAEQSAEPQAGSKVDSGDVSAGKPQVGVADESVAKDKLDPANPDKAEKVVPLRALQEEREAAKELKRQIAELQAQPKLSDEDKQLLAEMKAQRAAQQAPKEVDFLEDPKGYVDAKVQSALKKLEAVDAKAETVSTQAVQQQQFQALQNAVVASEQAFVASNPDYYDALNHVRSVRAMQIRLMDPTATDQQIGQAIAQEEMGAAAQLLRKNADPCKFAYDYAKTLGYTKKEAVVQKAAADLSAVRTMGSGGGDAASDAMDEDDPNAEFNAAKAAFGKRR